MQSQHCKVEFQSVWFIVGMEEDLRHSVQLASGCCVGRADADRQHFDVFAEESVVVLPGDGKEICDPNTYLTQKC